MQERVKQEVRIYTVRLGEWTNKRILWTDCQLITPVDKKSEHHRAPVLPACKQFQRRLLWKEMCSNLIWLMQLIQMYQGPQSNVCVWEVCFDLKHSDHVLKQTDVQSHSWTSSAFLATCEFRMLKVFEWSESAANLCRPKMSRTELMSYSLTVLVSQKLSVVIPMSRMELYILRRVFWEVRVKTCHPVELNWKLCCSRSQHKELRRYVHLILWIVFLFNLLMHKPHMQIYS